METLTSNGTGLVFLEFIEPKKRVMKMADKVRIYKSGGMHFGKSINELVKKITGQDAEKIGKLKIPVLMGLDKGEPIKKTIYMAFEKDGKYNMNYSVASKGASGAVVGAFRMSAIEITSMIPFNGKNSLSATVEAWKQNTLVGLKITIEA